MKTSNLKKGTIYNDSPVKGLVSKCEFLYYDKSNDQYIFNRILLGSGKKYKLYMTDSSVESYVKPL